jgi:hypothetical protein
MRVRRSFSIGGDANSFALDVLDSSVAQADAHVGNRGGFRAVRGDQDGGTELCRGFAQQREYLIAASGMGATVGSSPIRRSGE